MTFLHNAQRYLSVALSFPISTSFFVQGGQRPYILSYSKGPYEKTPARFTLNGKQKKTRQAAPHGFSFVTYVTGRLTHTTRALCN